MAEQAEKEGFIFKIKRFSIHDGPGIRTSVFLKGCPLSCIWCHSPEGIIQELSVWYNRNICISCGHCIVSCPMQALEFISDTEQYILIDRQKCNLCGNCVAECPTDAIQFTGSKCTVSQIMNEVGKDMLYYETSGGGVTLTGGEPLYQPLFASLILAECKKRNIHTAIETSLFCERKAIDLVSDKTDLIIADLKLFDPASHLLHTGKSNEIIRENFRYIAALGIETVVRIPLIENITDTETNLKDITDFVHGIRNDIPIELIDYNPLAVNNYNKLGIPFLLK